LAAFPGAQGDLCGDGLRSGHRSFTSAEKYRLVARVEFKEQLPVIETVLTHHEYDREDL
jgi:hypothetical protein